MVTMKVTGFRTISALLRTFSMKKSINMDEAADSFIPHVCTLHFICAIRIDQFMPFILM